MNKITGFSACIGMLITLLAGVSCTQPPPPAPPEPVYLPGSYEYFVMQHDYPKTMEIFRDSELMKLADRKSVICIDLSQQRGRLYVQGRVAADWPVSTGVSDHPTPTGSFSIMEKKKEYASNRYGKIYDAEGKCVNYNADFFKDPVPEGGKIVGSPMPNWQRLTHDGIGMHTGKVRAGRRLSHGCIRTPHKMACDLFGITACGTKVYISDKRESRYPVTASAAWQKAQDKKAAAAAQAAGTKSAS